jgi:hypothetical protein
MGKKQQVPSRQYTDEFKVEAMRLGESIGGNQAAKRHASNLTPQPWADSSRLLVNTTTVKPSRSGRPYAGTGPLHPSLCTKFGVHFLLMLPVRVEYQFCVDFSKGISHAQK